MKSKVWYAAIRKANSRPKSKAHREAISRARKGIKPKWRDPEGRVKAIVATREKNIKNGGCSMCGSLEHTLRHHKKRVVEGRKKSEVWRVAVVAAAKKAHTGKKASVKTRKRMSETHKIVQNTPEMKKIHSEKSKQMWANRTKAEREAIAEKSSKSQQGRIPNFDRFGQYYKGQNGKIWMRSGYEVKFAQWLDKWGIRWKFEPHSFYIGRGNWNGSNYTPDFYLVAHDLWIEIKGYLRDENVRKLNKFFKLWPAIAKKWYMLKQEGLIALRVL
jgi:hypothetical protein